MTRETPRRPAERIADLLVRAAASGARALSAEAAEALGRGIGDARRRLRPAEAEAVRSNLERLGLAGPTGAGVAARSAGNAGRGEPDRGGAREARLEQRVRETFRSFGLFTVEFFRGLALPAAEVARAWQVRGWRHLERAVGPRRGVILAGAHTGNWEHLGALAALLGRTIVAPVEIQFHPLLSAAVKEAKRARRIHSVPAERNLRALLRALEEGHLVALPLDGGGFRHGIPVDLLGARVRLAAGAVRLAMLSGCPIVPVFSRRIAFMHQDVRIGERLRPPPRGGKRDGRRLAQHLADLLGEQLRRSPGQWCVFRPLAWYHQE